MKLFRSMLFWTHLAAGVLGGAVILVMSFTGVVLALKPQIQNWIERDVRYVTPQTSQRLSPLQLLTAVKTARPETSPQSLNLSRDPALAATVSLGREGLSDCGDVSGLAVFTAVSSWSGLSRGEV